jgi:hypothetical protein
LCVVEVRHRWRELQLSNCITPTGNKPATEPTLSYPIGNHLRERQHGSGEAVPWPVFLPQLCDCSLDSLGLTGFTFMGQTLFLYRNCSPTQCPDVGELQSVTFTNTNPAQPAWPFEETAVDGNSTGYVDNFTGTVAVETGVFKYSVELEDGSVPPLDPVIIVRL